MYYSIDAMQLKVITEVSEGYHIFKIITLQHLTPIIYKFDKKPLLMTISIILLTAKS